MDRRTFLRSAAPAAVGGTFLGGSWLGVSAWRNASLPQYSFPQSCSQLPPSSSIVPVVGDGKWIWTEPPQEKTGYLEPRTHEVRVGIEMQGTGSASNLKAATPVPIECPEQEFEDLQILTNGCEAKIRTLKSGSAQLLISAPSLAPGQTIQAVATFYLKLYKQHYGFERDQFAYPQKVPGEIRKHFLQNSPGIQTSAPEVLELSKKLSGGVSHPWEKAQAFAQWAPENIEARIGPYTSVVAAIKNRVGDCEERSAVFVALCRSVGIPARLVWVPNHNWAEFYLHDAEGQGHWIPAHTSCYSWFGWNGVHELVLQKGDRLEVPERNDKRFRLFEDWAQWSGAKPMIRWLAEIVPTAREGEDAGPGKRTKDAKGEWVLTGTHPIDKILRR